MIVLGFIVEGLFFLGVGYILGINRNRAKAKAEIQAIQDKAGEQGKLWLEALKNKLGL